MKREQLIIAMDFDRNEDPTMDDFLIRCGHLPLHPEEAFFEVSSCISKGGVDLAICRQEASILAMREAKIPVIGVASEGEDLSADLVLCSFEALEEEDILRTYRRGMEIPDEIIRTRRLIIREMVPSDYPALLRLYRNLEAKGHMGAQKTGGAMEDFIEPLGGRRATEKLLQTYWDYLYPLCGMGGFLLIDREVKKRDGGRRDADKQERAEQEEERVVGRIDLKPTDRCGEGQAEVGYLIDASCRRRGYAKEALEGICQYAREKLRLRELVAHVHPDNLPSQRLLEKLDFVREERGPFGGENEGDHWHLSL